MNLDAMREQLKRHEGLRLKAYLCPTGHKTIGFGHNLEAHGQTDIEECTIEQAEQWLEEDITRAVKTVKALISPALFERCEDVRQRVLVNMAFALGGRLGDFKKMLRAVYEGQWLVAALEIANSRFAKQTGQRAIELEGMMKTGKQ
jgi:lysozyme